MPKRYKYNSEPLETKNALLFCWKLVLETIS